MSISNSHASHGMGHRVLIDDDGWLAAAPSALDLPTGTGS